MAILFAFTSWLDSPFMQPTYTQSSLDLRVYAALGRAALPHERRVVVSVLFLVNTRHLFMNLGMTSSSICWDTAMRLHIIDQLS